MKSSPELKKRPVAYFALLLPLEFRFLDDATEFAGLKSSAALPAVPDVTTLSDRLNEIKIKIGNCDLSSFQIYYTSSVLSSS